MQGIPVWLTRNTLAKIETKADQTVFALMDRLKLFNERVGCTLGGYLFILHGNRIGPSVGDRVIETVEDEMITLPRWDWTCLSSERPRPIRSYVEKHPVLRRSKMSAPAQAAAA